MKNTTNLNAMKNVPEIEVIYEINVLSSSKNRTMNVLRAPWHTLYSVACRSV